MSNLDQILTLLNIEIGEDRKLYDGKKNPKKNQYYYYKDQFYIVKLTKGQWMVCEDCKLTRKLLRKYIFYYNNNGYARTLIDTNKKTKYYHQLFIKYDSSLVADHINRIKLDNRQENLRIVTLSTNLKNKSIAKNNTSGITGIDKYKNYWRCRIVNNDGVRLEKNFNINKFGNLQAKQMAINKRNQWREQFNYLGE